MQRPMIPEPTTMMSCGGAGAEGFDMGEEERRKLKRSRFASVRLVFSRLSFLLRALQVSLEVFLRPAFKG